VASEAKRLIGQWIGKQIFTLACRINPAIPAAMTQVAEQHAQQLLQQHIAEHQLALHAQAVAQRAARQ
jgi:hypothetical protein